MKEIIEVFRHLLTEFGLSTTLLMLIALGEAVLIRYVYLEWRKDVQAFTEAAKGIDAAGIKIATSVGSLGHSLAEIRGALFARPVNSSEPSEGQPK